MPLRLPPPLPSAELGLAAVTSWRLDAEEAGGCCSSSASRPPCQPSPAGFFSNGAGALARPLRLRRAPRSWAAVEALGLQPQAESAAAEPGAAAAPAQLRLPTAADVAAAAVERGVSLGLRTAGPFFAITAAEALPGGAVLGEARGVVRLWTRGWLLHLDSVRMTRSYSSSSARRLLGVAALMGGLALCHGRERGCRTAELLAIHDTDEYHAKLVRYYRRLGFKVVHEVEGGSLHDVGHMLVWGGRGTRMNGDIDQLLRQWSKTLSPRVRST
eukprot:SM000062S19933  [mRNA]  locus=s62:493461:494471:+ [translate_table: standard]